MDRQFFCKFGCATPPKPALLCVSAQTMHSFLTHLCRPLYRDTKVLVTAKKGSPSGNTTSFEFNVLGDTMRLGSPSAVGMVGSNPFMQQKLLAMQEEISALLGQINVVPTASAPP